MAIAVESTLVLQAILGVAVAALGFAVAATLVAVPGARLLRWLLAAFLLVRSVALVNALRYLEPAPLSFTDPANAWMRWYYDLQQISLLLALAILALVPTRARLLSPRGIALVGSGALIGAGALLWAFAKPLVWPGWPAPVAGSPWTFTGQLTMQVGPILAILVVMALAFHETKGRPARERGATAIVLASLFPVFFQDGGRSIVEATFDGLAGDAFAFRGSLRVVPGDCCDVTLAVFAAEMLLAGALAVWFWARGRSSAALVLMLAGVGIMALLRAAPVGWGFQETNGIFGAVLLMIAAQRRGAFGAFRVPPTVSLALAAIAAACVFFAVNAYTLIYGNEILLAIGVFAGTIVGALTGLAMLPPGLLATPWSHASAGASGHALSVYRSAVRLGMASGAAEQDLREQLRPLRAELGLSDRDHAVLEHAMRAESTEARGVALRGGDVLLARYRIERLLGAGGMGEVYLARDERLGRPVALKRLTRDEHRDRAALERFQKETRLASALQHPNVVAVHDIEVVGNEAYLVMEYVSGGSVEERLRKAPLAPQEARRIALDVLSALEALHAEGIVHRDVKPSNILLDAHGRAKLSDFSVARAVVSGETVGFTRESATPVGTPAFMAPEQARGLAATPRSDVYSLAATIYAALAGRPPVNVEGLGEFEARLRVASESPAFPLKGAPAAMNAVLQRALEKDPSDRYPSAEAMRAALEG